jgi:uncharacterized protein (DUF427 family)
MTGVGDDPSTVPRGNPSGAREELAGTAAPPQRVAPGPGQESVWDFPRPPRVEPVAERLRVVIGGEVVAETTRGLRVVETASPPSYYFPPEDVELDALDRSTHWSVCEWKGEAAYHSYARAGRRVENVAWSYERPNPGYEALAGHLAFYAGRVDEAWIGDERATPQAGEFYGGWISSRVVGPFKGDPGTRGW